MKEREEMILKQVKYYFEKKTKLHLDLYERRFYNGVIVSHDDVSLIFDDKYVKGKLIFFSNIKNIEPYMEGVKYE